MTELHVIDARTEEILGDISAGNLGEVLEELEESDYIEGGEQFSASFGPDGCYYVYENNTRKLILSPIEDDDEEDEFDEDDDEDEFEDEDDET